ncbi:hypothetical protein GGTG_03157 [Gaeumannomyces tritici R3-111a-1]|uniref:Uncharacterized protein n=1 Tax=Gaeumannomyces tritici (strain R3-111a-1) TaxID=644352 RepID=J3NPE9_GAET3|nr:hypothetical protein GGTG_03157 [Gaeumannomyces tritici R3-111a-1]EJT78054.1 hypothetical protein GGTG_03157 [Gaeumannomyces tritici R3-111a-1]
MSNQGPRLSPDQQSARGGSWEAFRTLRTPHRPSSLAANESLSAAAKVAAPNGDSVKQTGEYPITCPICGGEYGDCLTPARRCHLRLMFGSLLLEIREGTSSLESPNGRRDAGPVLGLSWTNNEAK